MCDPPRRRVRKEIHDLTTEELRKFTNAVNILREAGKFQLFAELHAWPDVFRQAHG